MRTDEREALFVIEYPKDFNAARAARDAGFSEVRARQTGYDLLQKPEIQVAIASVVKKMFQKVEKETGITVKRLLGDIDRVATAAELDGKYSDALKAYELLGKHLKMFTDRLELSGNVGLAEKLKAARERSLKR